MLDKEFDNIIKKKVQEANPAIPESNWSDLADALGHENNDVFDDIIRSKVGAAQIAIPDPDWSLVSSKLEHTADLDFDSVIRSKVESADISIPKADWSSFSNKLVSEDEVIEAQVKDKLNAYEVNYNESHWVILRDRLRKAAYIRQFLYPAKAFEALFAALLFFTFANFSDYIFNYQDISVQQPLTAEADQSTLTYTETNDQVSEKENYTNTNETADKVSALSTNTKTTASNANNPVTTKVVRSSNNSTLSEIDKPSVTDNTVVGTQPQKTIFDSTPTKEGNEIIRNGFETPIISTINDIERAELKLFTVDSRAVPENTQALAETPEINTVVPKNEHNGLYLNVSASQNFNTVSTPKDIVYPVDAYQSIASNMNYSVGVSKINRNIELGTALSFAQLSYVPKLVNEVYDSKTDNTSTLVRLEEINYDIVSIPLYARWHQPLFKNTTVFADIGLSANAIATTDYQIFEEVSKLTGPPPVIVGQLPDEQTSPLLYRKDFKEGIFDGGSIRESMYGSLRTGAGIQYCIANKCSLFGRAGIDQVLGNFRFGPNSDKINTVGLQFGLKYQVK